jgi:hypothetical protein
VAIVLPNMPRLRNLGYAANNSMDYFMIWLPRIDRTEQQIAAEGAANPQIRRSAWQRRPD